MHDHAIVEEELIPQNILDGMEEIEREYKIPNIILPTAKQIIFGRIKILLVMLDKMTARDPAKLQEIRDLRKRLRFFCRKYDVSA